MSAGRAGLTLSEARVARLIAEGRTDEEIAERLGVTVHEVDVDLAELYRKLGVQSRTELALLISPSRPPEEANDAAITGGVIESTPAGHSEGRTTP
jgi:DNA-binding CsgD family transcriptional regulator